MDRDQTIRYAGYAHPGEILSDAVLSDEEKRETLKHWRATVWRRLDAARDQPAGRDFGTLLDELESARVAVEGRKVARTTPS
jgi:hypothetical protein